MIRSRSLFQNFSLVILLAVIALVILELIPRNEYAETPGSAMPVGPMIVIKGYPPVKGARHLLMTDVTLYKVDHLLEELYFRFSSNATLSPAVAVSGNLSPQKFQQENLAEMSSSIQNAEVAALNATPGHHVRCCLPGPQVLFTFPGTPADKYLRIGDIIERIDGHRIRLAVDVGKYIKQLKPGQQAVITVLRSKRLINLKVLTIGSQNGRLNPHGHVAVIGVEVQDRLIIPIHVSIKVGRIGGPSAGLMFALGIIQRLEHRDLTRGCVVAGTGTIDASGKVGAIGGPRQKIVAARDAGARYFLVPDVPENLHPARAGRGNVTVVPVGTLKQALHFLNSLKPCH
jgi:Lon-like protease